MQRRAKSTVDPVGTDTISVARGNCMLVIIKLLFDNPLPAQVAWNFEGLLHANLLDLHKD